MKVNLMTHGHALGRFVTPTLSIESGGRSSRSHPSFVFRHPSLALFFSFRWRLKLNAVTRLIRSVARRSNQIIFIIVAPGKTTTATKAKTSDFPQSEFNFKLQLQFWGGNYVVTGHRIVGVCPGACNPCC